MSSTQVAFDLASTHLMTQLAKSIDVHTNEYVYCTLDGEMCPIGVLIRDQITFDEQSTPLVFAHGIQSILKEKFGEDLDIGVLCIVQHVHDTREVAQWGADLVAIAERANLQLPLALVAWKDANPGCVSDIKWRN